MGVIEQSLRSARFYHDPSDTFGSHKWDTRPMQFINPLIVEPLDDGRNWKLIQPFSYAVGAPNGSTVVHCLPGELSDFASIPQVFWSFGLSPTGWYSKAAWLHDHLYKTGRIGDMVIDQKYADDVLNEAMCVLAAAWVLEHGRSKPCYPQIPHGELRSLTEREIIYWGVRVGGWATWRKYRQADITKGH